jgi:uncharacterized protein (TIGR02597 family)
MISLSAPEGATTYLSLPLAADAIFTGAVGSVQSNVILVSTPANPFATSLCTAGSPYFVRFLSGSEMGRTLLITGNTASSLTLDVTDSGSASVSLQTTNFAVAPGDLFEIYPGDTFASVFGANTPQNPLALTGASSLGAADWVNVPNPAGSGWQIYFFNTSLGYWVLQGTTTNANNTVIPQKMAIAISRRGGVGPAASLLRIGRVPSVAPLIKVQGSNAVSYVATACPVGESLSQLNLGPNWVMGPTPATANQVGIWSSTLRTFVSYDQLADTTWRQVGNATQDQSGVVVPAGSCISLVQHASATGGSSFLAPALPYRLN